MCPKTISRSDFSKSKTNSTRFIVFYFEYSYRFRDSETQERPQRPGNVKLLTRGQVKALITSLAYDEAEDVQLMVWVFECYQSIISRPEHQDIFYGRNQLTANAMIAEFAAISMYRPVPLVDPTRLRLVRGGLSQTRPPPRRRRLPMPATRMRRRLPADIDPDDPGDPFAAPVNRVHFGRPRDGGEPSTPWTRSVSPSRRSRRLYVGTTGLRRLRLYRDPRSPYQLTAANAGTEVAYIDVVLSPRSSHQPAHRLLPLPIVANRGLGS